MDPMSTTPSAPTVRNGAWRLGGNRTIPGVRIETGPSHIFVANENLMRLALDIANHIEANRQKETP